MSAGIPSWAVPGAKVVCLKGERWSALDCEDDGVGPSFGQIVTVRQFWAAPPWLPEAEPGGLELVEFPRRIYLVSYFRPVVDDDTEAKLFRTRRAPSRAARKRRQVASPAGTGEGGGAAPCVAAALAAISVPAGEFLPSGTLAARFCSVGAGRAALLSGGGLGQAVGHVEHGINQSFSGFGAVGNPAATPETPSPCRTITPASSATCRPLLTEGAR